MPFRLHEIEIEGFRGYRSARRLPLSSGLVVVRGPQRSGKSSTLNAIAWALAGGAIARKDVGPVQVRERIDWEVAHRGAKRCRVALTLRAVDGSGSLRVERVQPKGAATVTRDGNLDGTDPLAALGLTVDALVSSVFVPQEVVRAVLSIEPKSRGRLFLQLAGLETLEELAAALKESAKAIGDAEKRIAAARKSADDALLGQIQARKDDLDAARKAAREKGIKDGEMAPEAAPALADRCAAALREFCDRHGLPAPALPPVRDAADLDAFCRGLRDALRVLEASNPFVGEQQDLVKRQRAIESLQGDLAQAGERRDEVRAEGRSIADRVGTREDASAEADRADADLRRAGAELDVLDRALHYFEALPAEPPEVSCPVCGTSAVRIAHVREHLRAALGRAGVEPVRERRDALRTALRRLDELDGEGRTLESRVGNVARKAGELRGNPLDAGEDPARVLSMLRNGIVERLASLGSMIEERGRAVARVRQEMERADLVARVHEVFRAIARLDERPLRPEYGELKDLLWKAQVQSAIVAELRRALDVEKKLSFDAQFDSVRDDASRLYARLVARLDYPKLWIDSKAWSVRAGEGEEGVEVTTVFNVGDLTAVALCLFLATASRARHDAGFVLLDDPTQNLDDAHKGRLAEILAGMAAARQVVVASADRAFLEALERAGTAARSVIDLEPWDDARGCSPKETP